MARPLNESFDRPKPKDLLELIARKVHQATPDHGAAGEVRQLRRALTASQIGGDKALESVMIATAAMAPAAANSLRTRELPVIRLRCGYQETRSHAHQGGHAYASGAGRFLSRTTISTVEPAAQSAADPENEITSPVMTAA